MAKRSRRFDAIPAAGPRFARSIAGSIRSNSRRHDRYPNSRLAEIESVGHVGVEDPATAMAPGAEFLGESFVRIILAVDGAGVDAIEQAPVNSLREQHRANSGAK